VSKLDEFKDAQGAALTKFFDAIEAGEIDIKGIGFMHSFLFTWGIYHVSLPWPEHLLEKLRKKNEVEKDV
tara:strand:+ start:824 stop:1033 length:210 start_codon:yes stop_codon:yes gene_type:complete